MERFVKSPEATTTLDQDASLHGAARDVQTGPDSSPMKHRLAAPGSGGKVPSAVERRYSGAAARAGSRESGGPHKFQMRRREPPWPVPSPSASKVATVLGVSEPRHASKPRTETGTYPFDRSQR